MHQMQPTVRDGPIISTKTVVQMLFYTFLMVTVPISSYFLSKNYILEKYEYSENNSLIIAAVVAVCMVHVVLGLFVYAAYNEDIPSQKKAD